MPYSKIGTGKQALPKAKSVVTNCILPFELRVALVKVLSYRFTGKGSVIGTEQSSQWLPVSAVPATRVPVRVVV
jgi:hypothetical protein